MKTIKTFVFLIVIGYCGLSYSQEKKITSKNKHIMTEKETIAAAVGQWESIAPEVRPGSSKNSDGSRKPFYLTRKFALSDNNQFTLIVINYADPYGKTPLVQMEISGHIEWKGEHPIKIGAQKVDFTADGNYIVTPLVKDFADILNQYTKGFDEWEVGKGQSILKKAFAPFGLAEGQVFKEYDLIYVYHDMLFWGARNVDGRGFDTEENRPTNLQIPMIRKTGL